MKENKPSKTAIIVARNIALAAARANTSELINKETAQFNSLMLDRYSQFSKIVRYKWFQIIFRIFEFLTIQGLALHQALRKLHIEKIVRTAIGEKFEQIIILGGGLDTLALRLHKEFPEIKFLELDHPATQKGKRDAITKICVRGSNLNFLDVDFTDANLARRLNAFPDYSPKAKTMFVCEGVLMYLSEPKVDQIFKLVKHHRALDSRFIFTFMEPDESGRPNFRGATFLVRLWLKWKNEPFKWGLNKNELTSFLSSKGFGIKELATAETFRKTYLKQKALSREFIAEGENLCVCESLP